MGKNLRWRNKLMKTDDEIKKIINANILLWSNRIYILAGNLYSWFWLIRAIFCRPETSFEDYLMWFFLTAGFYWFIIEHDEIFIKAKEI